MISSKQREINDVEKLQLILECAKDLRKYFDCDCLANEYKELEDLNKIVQSWELNTLPQEWGNYDLQKKRIFEENPLRILEYALYGWKSRNPQIGSLEGLLEKYTKEPQIRIKSKSEKSNDFSFIDNEYANIVYQMSKNPLYHQEGKIKSKLIAETFNREHDGELDFRLVNTILRKYSQK